MALSCSFEFNRLLDWRFGEPRGERWAEEVHGRMCPARPGSAPSEARRNCGAARGIRMRLTLLHRLGPFQSLHACTCQDQVHESVGTLAEHRRGTWAWSEGGTGFAAEHAYWEGGLWAPGHPVQRASWERLVAGCQKRIGMKACPSCCTSHSYILNFWCFRCKSIKVQYMTFFFFFFLDYTIINYPPSECLWKNIFLSYKLPCRWRDWSLIITLFNYGPRSFLYLLCCLILTLRNQISWL